MNRRNKRWIFGVAALLIAAPPFFLWLMAPKPEALQPIQRFLPDRLSAAVRVGDLAGAWQRHWTARGGKTTPENALQEFLDAQGKWDKMVAKDGEMAAQARIKLIPHFLFETIGPESWIFFGEWDGTGAAKEPAPSASVIEKAKQAKAEKEKKAAAKNAAKNASKTEAKQKTSTKAPKKSAKADTAKTSSSSSKAKSKSSSKKPAPAVADANETESATLAALPAAPSASTPADSDPLVGLVMILPASGSIKTTVGPLAEFLLDKTYGITTSRVGGETLYEYESLHSRRCLAVVSVGGRIVISLRRRGPGPLPAIVSHVRDPKWSPPADSGAESLAAAAAAKSKSDSLFATFRPEMLFAQVARLDQQRGKTPSKAARKTTRLWQARLAGFDRLTLNQTGDSFFDMNLISEIHSESNLASNSASTTATTTAKLESLATSRTLAAAPASFPAPAIQFDARTAALHSTLSRLAIDAKAEGINPMALELFIPGVVANFQKALDRKGDPSERAGTTIFFSSFPMLARILTWDDRSPLSKVSASPAEYWGSIAEGRAKGGRGDTARWQGAPPAADAKPESAWEAFASAEWSHPSSPPDEFLAVDFAAAAGVLDRIPLDLLKKDMRKKMKGWQGLARGLSVAAGGAILRLDNEPGRSVLRLRTMSSNGANTPSH